MRGFLAGFAGAAVIALIVGYVVVGEDFAQQQIAQQISAPTIEEARAQAATHPEMKLAAAPSVALPFPVAIKAKFDLTDHNGRDVTEASFAGKSMAIFFGYANCEAICSVALPRLGEALELMGDKADNVAALMITVDPQRDTVEAMGPALAKWHPKLVGLTGSDQALADARNAFQVTSEKIFDDPEGNPVYAHGGFIYFVGEDGEVRTIMPPILGPERMAELMTSYM
ncbi:MAG: SCO family protein [Pseudomonadota bacterium]